MRRCNEIQQKTNTEDWNYILTDLNTTDYLSREILLGSPNVQSSWFTGLSFKEITSICNFVKWKWQNTTETTAVNYYQELNAYTTEVNQLATNTGCSTIFGNISRRGKK